MSKCIAASQSEKGKAIWEGISRAAENIRVPEWAKQKAIAAAEASAKRIIEQALLENEKK
jgi:hypothetical protein